MTKKINEHTILLVKTIPINDVITRSKHIHKNNGKLLILGIVILIVFYILLKKM